MKPRIPAIMTEQAGPNVGLRIRALRKQQGLSLRALAERCGLSANAISRIERGENSPTVSSLHLLATALVVPITDFFQEDNEQAAVFVKRDQRLHIQGGSIAMESLGIGLRNQRIEPFLMTVEPWTGSFADSIAHPGEEFIHCLEGEIEYFVGDQLYRMEVGDSLLFEATQPHYFHNATGASATLMLIFQSAESTMWHRHHI
jgi:transcriptional regulator with XRE-family HTH domain